MLELIEELRDELAEDFSGPVPVFPFGYGWRMPLDWTEELLAHDVVSLTRSGSTFEPPNLSGTFVLNQDSVFREMSPP